MSHLVSGKDVTMKRLRKKFGKIQWIMFLLSFLCQIRSFNSTLATTHLLPQPAPTQSIGLGGFYQVVNVDVKVVIKLDEIDRGLGFNLMDDHASPFGAVLFSVLHLFAHQAVHHLARFPLRRWGVI